MGATDIIKFSPHIPNNVPAVKLLVAPEGKWHPDSDGTWPVHPFAYDRWEKEELSWYNTSYIHAGLNPFMEYQVKGKELLDLMECISVNTFRKFPVGKARHTIICGEDGKIIIDGIPVLRESCLIPLKAKAWLVLTERKMQGEHIDSKNIRKHKNDVFRLAQLLSPTSRQELVGTIEVDMREFLNRMDKEEADLKSLGIKGVDKKEMLNLLYECYGIKR